MRKYKLSITLAALTAVVISACAPNAVGGGGTTATSESATELSLVGFAVPKGAHDEAQRAFAQTDAGSGTTWSSSYGASGDQSRAVANGLGADLVHFSLEGDVTRLVDEGLVAEDWNSGEHAGIVSDSVAVLVVRKGNPKNVTGWEDLVRDDIQIGAPNRGSSGSARWNILGAYGSVLAAGGDEAAGEEYLRAFFTNIAALPGSGRDATTAFTSGTGDVLISYENEAILARQNGEDFDYIVPEVTLLIENPAAVTVDAKPEAKAYLDFLFSPEGQQIFASKGFRPIDPSITVDNVEGANDPANPFPTPRVLQTIDETFGGWDAVNKKFFGDDGLVTQIQTEIGKQ
jgi:sulfate transport system substrate-binding protein